MVSSVTAHDPVGDPRPALRVGLERALQRLEDDPELLGIGRGGVGHRAGLLVLDPLVDEQGRVAAVVEDHVRPLAVGPGERLLGAPPVLLECLALPGVDRDPGRGDGRGGVVLGREDVAGGPADLGAQRDQSLDQDRGLDGHVQGARDARALERLRGGVLLAGLHEARHLVLGQGDLLAAELGQADVGDLVVLGRCGCGGGHGSPGLGCLRIADSSAGLSPGCGLAHTAVGASWILRPLGGSGIRRDLGATGRKTRKGDSHGNRNQALAPVQPGSGAQHRALFAALSGAAVALPGQNTVNSGDIIDQKVKARDLKTASVKADEISDGIQPRSNSVSVPGGGAENGAYIVEQVTASCAPGEELISGSGHWGNNADEELFLQEVVLTTTPRP